MAKIYLPETINQDQCVVVQSEGHIRVYDSRPNGYTQNNVSYRDYYLRENYLMSSNTTNFNTYTSLNCLDYNQFTNDYWYRPDIWQSLLCFFIIAIVCLYFPYKIISRMLGRWLKI